MFTAPTFGEGEVDESDASPEIVNFEEPIDEDFEPPTGPYVEPEPEVAT